MVDRWHCKPVIPSKTVRIHGISFTTHEYPYMDMYMDIYMCIGTRAKVGN